MPNPRSAPPAWSHATTATECTLHQLAPYIGKLKSSIGGELIREYSRPGACIVDPFCGSGTIPLEAVLARRKVYATDASKYATTLTNGKLAAPPDLAVAVERLSSYEDKVSSVPAPNLRSTPKWVREFFHPQTLKDAIRWARVLQKQEDDFTLSCLLGILHHQRPGFLSYPSSHLVPYLRTRKFPRKQFPELYEHRAVLPRLRAKIVRALRRANLNKAHYATTAVCTKIEESVWPESIDCVITSPPYMNALDYSRDNRLRLWFLGQTNAATQDMRLNSMEGFQASATALATKTHDHLRRDGRCVVIVGEKTSRKGEKYPSEVVHELFDRFAPGLKLEEIITDTIPDVRRSRRKKRGVRQENILVFRKS